MNTRQPDYRSIYRVMMKNGRTVDLVHFVEFGGWMGFEETENYRIPLFTPSVSEHDLKCNLGEIEDWTSMNEGLENQNYVDHETAENIWNAKRFVEEWLGVTFGRIPGTEGPG